METYLINQNINLSEYYLDKFNGFNKFSNHDDLTNGLIPHYGGDFKIAATFNANFGGIPTEQSLNINEKIINNKQLEKLKKLPIQKKKYFAQNINILSRALTEKELQRKIKCSILQNGAIATLQYLQTRPYGYLNGKEVYFYFPHRQKIYKPNHAINIIGWDDDLQFGTLKGMWIIRDSTPHINKSQDNTFYIPYDDYYTGKDKDNGAVEFTDIIAINFDHIYFHSLHGWVYTTTNPRIKKVANLFKTHQAGRIIGIGIYTTQTNEHYTITLKKNNLKNKPLRIITGKITYPGFHYISLPKHLHFNNAEKIIVILQSSSNQYAYDASFSMDVLLGDNNLSSVNITSQAHPNESFYYKDGQWRDFYCYKDLHNKQKNNRHAMQNNTANISINIYTKFSN